MDAHTAPAATTTRPYSRLIVWSLALLGAVMAGFWLLGTPPGVLGKADAVGYAICHRISERSFHVHDRALPLCARCTGIYLGVITGLLMGAARGRLRAARLPRVRILLVMALLGTAYAFDGLNSYLSLFEFYTPLYQPTNTLRLITGLSFGLAMISVALPVFNAMVWSAPQAVAPLRSLRELAALYAVAGGIATAVLIQVPALLVALGLVSVAGVLLMFVLIGGAGFVTLTGHDNSFTRWRELAIPALAGLVFALSMVSGIDLLRYLLTGTWGGFLF